MMETVKAKWKSIFSGRGFFGCCTKSPLTIDGDEPSNILETRDKEEKKLRISEVFLSSSSSEMDNSTLQSPRNISTTGAGTSCPNEFVNHGLVLWNQIRQQWTESKSSQTRPQVKETRIRSNATCKSLLGTNKPFPHPIPLSQMIDFLVNVWEEEGLFD